MLLERADRKLRLTDTIAPAPVAASTAGERFRTAFDAQIDAYNLNSEQLVKEDAFDTASDGVFALTGVRLDNPFRTSQFQPRGRSAPGGDLNTLARGFETEIERLAATYPDKAAAIRQHGGVLQKAYARRNASVRRADDAVMRSPSAVNIPMLGPVDPAALGGSVVGSLFDPATLALNLVGNVKNGGKLAWSAAKAALINGGAEIAMQPFIKDWANEAGDPYTWSDAGRQVVAAAILGGTIDAGVRGGYRAVQRGRGLTPEMDADGTIKGWKRPEDVLEDAAKKLPEDHPVRRAAEGDPAAAAEVARATGAIENPAVRGAIDDIEIDAATPLTVPGVDDGTNLLNLAQALRHADDPGSHPPPVRAEPVPEATAPKLADDAPAPGKSFEIDGRAVTYAEVDLKQTAVDPATFQFKGGGDSAGATERLQGVEMWDPIAAGRAVIYERTDGTRVIADAHQRRALAMRLKDQDTSVPAFIFREADGWRPEDVRALAAKKNLQEGSGSVMDAATVLRERPDILDSSVPLRSEAMRQARSLAKLSDEAFASVKAGVVAPNVGALIGDLVPDKARHGGILDEVAGLDPANAREARLMISELMQTPVHLEEQMTLLGVMRVERSLMKERVKVLDGALQALRQDARIFGLLDREAGRIEEAGNTLAETNAARAQEAAALAETIERLAGQAGPVADWLNASARAVASGEKPGIVAKAFAKRVADTIERDGFGALFRDPTPLRAGGFDEPGGPDAQAQVKRLEMELRDDIEIAKKPEIADQRQAVLFSLIPKRQQRAAGMIEEVWGPKFQKLMSYEYEKAVAGSDYSTQYDILAAKYHNGTQDSPQMRAAIRSEMVRLEGELGQEYVDKYLSGGVAKREGERLADAANFDAPIRRTPRAMEEWAAITAALKEVQQMLPADVRLRVAERQFLDDLDAEVYGYWDPREKIIAVALGIGDPVRTARHETIHALRQTGLLSDAEFDTMYRFAERFGLREAYEIDSLYAGPYKKAYGHHGDAYIESLLREETVANLFSDAAINGRRFGDLEGGRGIDKIIDLIRDFLVRLRNALGGLGFRDVRDVFEAIESGAVAARAEIRDAQDQGDGLSSVPLAAINAYHASAARFERFDWSKIGGGEGAQAFGFGHYFAGSDAVGKYYQSKFNERRLMVDGEEMPTVPRTRRYSGSTKSIGLDDVDRMVSEWAVVSQRQIAIAEKLGIRYTEAEEFLLELSRFKSVGDMRKYYDQRDILDAEGEAALSLLQKMEDEGRIRFESKPAHFYEVSLNVDGARLLDLDKPFDAQPENVRGALRKALSMHQITAAPAWKRLLGMWDKAGRTGMKLVKEAIERGENADLTARLRRLGIQGIVYKNGSHRHVAGSVDPSSFNYVIFDDSLIEIVAIDGQPVANLGAALADVERTADMGDLVQACKF